MSMMSIQMGKMFTKNDNVRDEGLRTPKGVLRFDNICYGPDTDWQVLDVYRPKDAEGRLPVIVSVHGGGWVYGDKERYQYYCMDLAERGFAVINFTYRLAPASRFPAQLEDTVLAFRWAAENAEEYGLDMGELFAVGDSAGAHLLSLYCIMCGDEEYGKAFDLAPGPCPRAVALNCGAYDISGSGMMMRSLLKDLLGERSPEKIKAVSPLIHISEDFPPAYIMTAKKDFLRRDAEKLYRKLSKLGVSCKMKVYDNEKHSLGHVFHLDIRSEDAKLCNDEECGFFRGYIEN